MVMNMNINFKKIMVILALMVGVSNLQGTWYNALWSKVNEQSVALWSKINQQSPATVKVMQAVGVAACGSVLIAAAVCLYQRINRQQACPPSPTNLAAKLDTDKDLLAKTQKALLSTDWVKPLQFNSEIDFNSLPEELQTLDVVGIASTTSAQDYPKLVMVQDGFKQKLYSFDQDKQINEIECICGEQILVFAVGHKLVVFVQDKRGIYSVHYAGIANQDCILTPSSISLQEVGAEEYSSGIDITDLSIENIKKIKIEDCSKIETSTLIVSY